MTGLRGTGKTVLLSEFAGRAERAGWITLQREVGERHRDDSRLADAIEEDVDALRRRLSSLAAVGQTIENGVRYLRPRRLSVGEIGYEPAYEERPAESADRMRVRLSELDARLAGSDRAGALLLYDEAHLLADDKARDRYPLSSLLAAVGQAQRSEPRVRFVLCGLPTLSLNLKRARTYAERMFRHVVVGNLDRGDAWDALGLPLAAADRSFSLTVIADIVETTAGYPYFLQFFGAYLCRSVPTPNVSVDDYRALEPALLHELDLAFFEDRFEGASPTEQRVLEAMGRSHGQIRIGTLRQQLADQSGLDLLVRRLIDRGLSSRSRSGSCCSPRPSDGGRSRAPTSASVHPDRPRTAPRRDDALGPWEAEAQVSRAQQCSPLRSRWAHAGGVVRQSSTILEPPGAEARWAGVSPPPTSHRRLQRRN